MSNTNSYNKKPAYIQVLETLSVEILSGKLKPGDKLPSERELAKSLNVSRSTVREALKMLASKGLVRIVHGEGTFVAPEFLQEIDRLANSKKKDIKAIEDIIAVRKLLEIKASEWAAKRASQDHLRQLGELIKCMKDEIPNQDPMSKLRLLEYDTKFHLLIAEASNNRVLFKLMQNFLEFLSEIRYFTLKIGSRQIRSVEEHEKIATAIINRDPERASKYMEEHLNSVEKDIFNFLLKK
ncbi:MAG: FadR/GntR family transcriptional regulator [Archaeoglobaceae archaeon]